jgi:hypothetical protein
MAWTYSGDPDLTERDEVRFLIQDTDSGLPLLQDAEIDFLIERWKPRYDSLTYVAAVAAAAISRKFTGIVTVSADGVTINTSDLTSKYRDMAVQLRSEYVASQIGGEIDISNIMVGQSPDFSIKPLAFGIGLHDNPEAGQQDFGAWLYDPFVDASGIPW